MALWYVQAFFKADNEILNMLEWQSRPSDLVYANNEKNFKNPVEHAKIG